MKNLENLIYNYKTKNPQGFLKTEINEILKKFPNINKNKFDDALMGITCMVDNENNLIIYHCDLYHALLCGIENRDLKVGEWD